VIANGWVKPGFEGVQDAFAANLAEGRDIGAAFSAYHRGQKVVDLWGGIADRETQRPWAEDTLTLVFSTTKGATAICAHRLAQDGRLDLDAPVTKYWPEFGAAGKEKIRVSHLLSHQAGLAWIEGEISEDDAMQWDVVVAMLEELAPHWEPGTAHGYHATTYGWLVGEVVRRVSGKSLGTFFHDDVATPLALDFWIGLPESEEARVSTLVSWRDTTALDDATIGMLDQFMGAESTLGKALYSPGGALKREDLWNTRELHAAEVPAANGIGDARSIARMYAACIGDVDGVRLLTPEQLKIATTQQTSGPNTVLMGLDVQFGLGFMLPSSIITIGGPQSFGHFGYGGSMGWADPDAELALGYAMNKLDLVMAGDVRSTSLLDATYAAIK
jgi:CubicO group peptidase (beta-lactamase class C family)